MQPTPRAHPVRTVESTARRLKDAAAEAIAKRKYTKAIELYLALTHAEPDEPTYHLRLGDLRSRLNELALAMEHYRTALELFEKQYSYRKAAAVATLMLQFDPHDLDAHHFLNRWRHHGESIKVRSAKPIVAPIPSYSPPPDSEPKEEEYEYLGAPVDVEPSPYVPPEASKQPANDLPTVSGPTASSGWGFDSTDERHWDDLTLVLQRNPLLDEMRVPTRVAGHAGDGADQPTIVVRARRAWRDDW